MVKADILPASMSARTSARCYAWADGHVRGVDVMRVQDGKVLETFAYVKG
jgi:hypothetical protein